MNTTKKDKAMNFDDTKEKTIEISWGWTKFAFGICYMYTDMFNQPNSISIEIAFFTIDIVW